ncbi:MAG: hypothetical protein IKK36_13695 [Bacteroidales bacterium]|nr:hypothetical protein [Bacteroidales bacterium]MBR6068284.1 hypothetical protein [Bacteroidales bacterium]
METTIKIICALIAILMLTSCNRKPIPAVYDYEVYKTQEIKLEENDSNCHILGQQMVQIDGRDVIVLLMWEKRKLSFYDLKTEKKINEIVVDTIGRLWGFHYINKDSIIVHCSAMDQETELNSPQAQRLIDYNGVVKKIYGYDIDESELQENNYNKEDLLPFIGNNFAYCKNNIVCPESYSYEGLVGTKEYIESPRPIAIRMDLDENKCHASKKHKWASIKEGEYYPTYVFSYITSTSDGWPLIRNSFCSDIFEWRFDEDTIIKHSVKSRLIDTIMPLENPAEYEYNVPEYYQTIKYLPAGDIYYNMAYFCKDFYNDNIWSLVIFDKNFNYLGEIYNNERWLVANEKKIFDCYKKDDKTLAIDYIRLVKTNRDYEKYIDSCKNDLQQRRIRCEENKRKLIEGALASVNFVKSNMEITASNYKILTLYCNEGCIGCESVVLKTLIAYKEILNKIPFYIIVSADNMAHINSYMEQNNLYGFNKIAIDSTGIMKSIANTNLLHNPRLTIVEDDVATLDTIYQAMDIEDKLLPQITGPDEYTKYMLDEDGNVIIGVR